MNCEPKTKNPGFVERLTTAVTVWVGSVQALCLAILMIVVWAAIGPFFGFNDTWQLVINTSTTIITFLMVFIIQRAQNKDTAALHLKLNELIATKRGASNSLINVEDLSEEEVRALHQKYESLSKKIEENLEDRLEDEQEKTDSRKKEAAAS